MADTTALKNRIRAAIKANDNQEITGPVLQQSLLDMVDELSLNQELASEIEARQLADIEFGDRINGLQLVVNTINTKLAEGYIYAGIATPSTNPGTPVGKVFYVAVQAGTYTNFSNTQVTEGITILKNNGTTWIKELILGIDDRPITRSKNPVSSGGVAAAIFGGEIFSHTLAGVGSPAAEWAKWSVQLSEFNLNAGDTIHMTVKGHNIETLKTQGAYFYLNGFTNSAHSGTPVTIVPEKQWNEPWEDVDVEFTIPENINYIEVGINAKTTSYIIWNIDSYSTQDKINLLSPTRSYSYIGRKEIDFSSLSLNVPMTLYYGEGVNITSAGIIKPLKQVYSCGTAQADIRAITYEDGSPIIENGCIFLSISSRTGGAGPTILKYNIGTCEMEMIGVVLTSINGTYWHGAAAHIMFNRETGKWQITISGHRVSHRLYYGISYSDLRFGVNHIELTPLTYGSPTSGDEDAQVLKVNEVWYLVYSKGSSSTEVQIGNSSVGPFTHHATSNINSTGITTTRIGGQYYCIHGSLRADDNNNYVYESFPDLTTNGNLNIDIDNGAYRGWGTVIPIPNGGKTSYLFFTFDRLVSSDEDDWTYGALYVYRSAESNQGIEFDIDNMGIHIGADIVATYSISNLNFKRMNAQRNCLDMQMLLSQIKLNSNVLLKNSNIYKKIGSLSLSMSDNEILVYGTGQEILIGGIHNPYSCYLINVSDLRDGEERFLFIGNNSGVATLKIIFKKNQDSILCTTEISGVIETLGYFNSNNVLIAFSGSCLFNKDYIYLYSYR